MNVLPSLDRYDRQGMSLSTRDIAAVFAAGEPSRPLPDVGDCDWDDVFQAVYRNGILGITYHYLVQQQSSQVPVDFQNAIANAYRLEALRMALVNRQVRGVLEQLNGSGIDYLVVKGPVVAHCWYPNAIARTFNDLDIVIRERDWSATHQFLTAIGYSQQENLPTPPPKLIVQTVLYETKYTHRDTGFRIEVHYDDLLNVGLVSRDIDGFWQRAITLDIQGVAVKALSPEDQLIHLCAHMHYHGYTRLNWFTDIALIMRNQTRPLDWDRVCQIAAHEDTRLPVYYSLYFLEKLMQIAAPPSVIDRLRPDGMRQRLHEFYMPQEKILSFQSMPRPDFSFYFIPLYKRLLPDLLVMGRRNEKLNYLLHLMAPPRDWLRFYYRLDNPHMVTFHYLLHPLRLLAIYMRETWLLIIKRRYVDYH